MSATDLYKIDLKGNQILKIASIIADSGASSPVAIETDGVYLYILWTDGNAPATKYYIYKFDKKGLQVNVSSSAGYQRRGITTDGSNLFISTFNVSAGMDVQTKKYALVKSVVGLSSWTKLTFNGESIVAVGSTANQFQVLDRLFNVKQSVTVGGIASLSAICSVKDMLFGLDTSVNLISFTYAGNLIKSVALPTPSSDVYVDLCHDRDFLWLVAYVPTDIEPPIDEK